MPSPSFAEHVCLTMIVQGVSHGWALGTMLASDGELGRIWTLSRPLTYRAIDGLVDKGLVTRRWPASGQGRDRVVLAATAAGRRVARRWLDTPVEHLRDVRTDLLIKLALRRRAGLDTESLLAAQQAAFAPTIDALMSTRSDEDLIDVWRRESALAVRRFIEHALHPTAPSLSTKPEFQLGAPNQLHATVTAIHHGEELTFAPGDAVVVVIKSAEVMLATDEAG